MKKINPKNFLYLSLTFILFTAIGTLTHEGGHIAVAEYYGYETTLHYGSMNWKEDSTALSLWKPDFDTVQAIYWRHKTNQDIGVRHSESDRLDSLNNRIKEIRTRTNNSDKSLMIRIGGPAQTLLTSILGILILLYRRKSIVTNGIKLWDWLAVFLALFSLRFVANMTLSILSELRKPNGTYFGGDEARIARSLNWPEGSVAIPLFCIGLAIALWVIFRVIPVKHRFTFILSGLIGGSAGYIIWLHWLGSMVLP